VESRGGALARWPESLVNSPIRKHILGGEDAPTFEELRTWFNMNEDVKGNHNGTDSTT